MRACEHSGFESLAPLLQSLGLLQVQIVGGLVEQQQSCTAEFEQQNLDRTCRLRRGSVEGLFGCSGKLVTVQCPGHFLTRLAASIRVASMQDLHKRTPSN